MVSQALVAVSPGKVELQSIPMPTPGPEDVIVRARLSWISNGTESSTVKGERIGGDTAWRPGDPLPFPHVPGYQKTGIVEWTGSEVDHVKPGDLVFASISRVEGMFFDYAGHVSPSVCHKSFVAKLPDGADEESFSGLVLTQVGWNMAQRPSLMPGDKVVTLGDGMVGHWVSQSLRLRGAKVMMLGRRNDRLEKFVLHSGDAKANVRELESRGVTSLQAVKEWAPEGIQAIAHTSGDVRAFTDLLPSLRRFGHIVTAGFMGADAMLDVQTIRDQELTLHAVAGLMPDRMARTLDLVASGDIDTKSLITHRMPIERGQEAFDLIFSKAPGVLGIVLDWRTP
jgi:bacteriochlorophyllide a dehydrogenase